jgi:hypothetical protein
MRPIRPHPILRLAGVHLGMSGRYVVGNPVAFVGALLLMLVVPSAVVIAIGLQIRRPDRSSIYLIATLQIVVLLTGSPLAIATVPILVLISSPGVRRYYLLK